MVSCRRKNMIAIFCTLGALLAPHTASAQQAKPIGFPDAPGREVLLGRCFQCHGDAMWRDHRQDRRGWEGVMYRMVGRGALWSESEINSMASYLAVVYAPPTDKPTK